MKRALVLNIDGASRGNPGESAIGVVVREQGEVIKTISRVIGSATNNIAEYSALIAGLQEALILKAAKVLVYSDSELLCHQLNGKYQIRNSGLKVLYDQVLHLKSGFEQVEIVHVPREQNKQADELASQALKEAKPAKSTVESRPV